MDRTGTIERLSGFFAESPAVAVAWLFGSFARGDARADSDVDVAALFRHTPAATFEALPLRLEGEIERLLRRTTQVVVMNRAPPDLRARVLRDGRLLIDRDPSLRIRFSGGRSTSRSRKHSTLCVGTRWCGRRRGWQGRSVRSSASGRCSRPL